MVNELPRLFVFEGQLYRLNIYDEHFQYGPIVHTVHICAPLRTSNEDFWNEFAGKEITYLLTYLLT